MVGGGRLLFADGFIYGWFVSYLTNSGRGGGGKGEDEEKRGGVNFSLSLGDSGISILQDGVGGRGNAGGRGGEEGGKRWNET